MTIEVDDLRKGERFNFAEPHAASFAGNDVSLQNVSLRGMQFFHEHPLRIGTRGRLTMKTDDGVVTLQARVVWSHFARATTKGSVYRSGVAIDEPDHKYAAAMNTLIRAGVLQRDLESLERKRQRAEEREAQRAKATPRNIPTSTRIE